MIDKDRTPVRGDSRVSCKVISCVVPDDGTDLRLLLALRSELGIIRANSTSCRGVAALGDVRTKRGKLPASTLVKLIDVIVDDDHAETVFDFIFERAKLAKPGRGAMWQAPLIGCTRFALPEDVPDEKDI